MAERLSQKDIAILGASGFVGSTILPYFSPEIATPGPEVVDITDEKSLTRFLQHLKPTVIINLAAYTDVNEAEKQRDDETGDAYKINVTAVKNLCDICSKLGIFLITIGTDFEFSGLEDNKGPYKENEARHKKEDLSWYGDTKAQGAIFNQNGAHVRISYPYGNIASPKDFVRKIQSFIEKKYKLVDDQWITPTYIPDLANVLLILSKEKEKGIYHVASPLVTNFYEFAKAVDPKAEIAVAHMSEINAGSAKRPQYGGLDVASTEQRLQVKFHTWKEGLKQLLAQRY